MVKMGYLVVWIEILTYCFNSFTIEENFKIESQITAYPTFIFLKKITSVLLLSATNYSAEDKMMSGNLKKQGGGTIRRDSKGRG